MARYYIQFREGEAYLYDEQEWFEGGLLSNFRRAKFEASSREEANHIFDTLYQACKFARPTIEFDFVSSLIEEF